jgi:vitamin B12 transporter
MTAKLTRPSCASRGLFIFLRPVFFLLGVPACAVMTAPVVGQTAPAAGQGGEIIIADTLRSDIIVIASRAPLYPEQTGATLSTVPLISQLQTNVASDLLRLTPGLSVGRTGPVGSLTQVRMRGAEANHTLVFIDGVEANDPAAGEFDFSGLSTAGAQRIDVLRGPQSALWGTEALGGVISLTTQIPYGAYARAEAGTRSSTLGAAGYGVQSATGKLGAHVAYDRTAGVSVAQGGTEKDGASQFNAVVLGELSPGEAGELGFSARLQTSRVAFDDYVGGLVTPLVDANFSTKAQRIYLRGYGRVQLFDNLWSHELSARYVDTRNRNFTSGVNDSSTFGRRLILGYQTGLTFDTDALRHKLIGAVEFRNEHFRNVTPDASPFFDPNQRQSRRQTSFIGDYTLKVAERGTLAASIRRDQNSGFADATTWRTNARVTLTPDIAARASYGTAITNPGFYEQFGFAPASFKGNPLVTPEKGSGWDVGLDGAFPNGKLSVTYFNMRLKDEIISTFDSNTFLSGVANGLGTSKRSGVEVEGQMTLGDVQVFASYTYTKSSQPKLSGSSIQAKELRRPAHVGSLAANWMLDKLTLTGALAYQGQNRDVAFDANFNSVPVVLKKYVLATAAASYDVSDRVKIYARVENAFDTRTQDVFGYTQAGLSARAGVTANW